MMRGRKNQQTLFSKIAYVIARDIVKAAESNKYPPEKLLKDLFGLKRFSELKLLEKIEEVFDGKYVVIPVIVQKNDTKKLEKLLDITSVNLRELVADIIEWIEKGEVKSESEIDKLLKEKLCVFGDCEESETVKSEKEETTEETGKPRKRRGRPRKKKNEDDELSQQKSLIPTVEDENNEIDDETEETEEFEL